MSTVWRDLAVTLAGGAGCIRAEGAEPEKRDKSAKKKGVGEENSVYDLIFFFSSRRRHTRFDCDWSSDVCSSDLPLSKVVTVAAITGRSEGGKEMRSIAVAHGTPGFTVGREYRKLGWRASDTREQIGRASCRERV